MKKWTHVFLSLLLICISAGLLGLLLSNMRHNAKSAAESLAREELDIDVAIFAKQDIPERLIPELIEPSGKGENLIYGFDEDEQYRLNRFLTYFAEQDICYYDPADAEAMVNFAYQYLRINHGNFEALAADGLLDQVEGALFREDSNFVISSDAVDAITDRIFGQTIPHTEDAYYYEKLGADYYEWFNVATAVYANGDDIYTVEFDTYTGYEPSIPCPFSEEDLANAEKRSDWTQNDCRLFSYFAEATYPEHRWRYVGTTSGALSPNPYEYLGYDVYAIDYYSLSFLYVVPYGGSAPAPVVYSYDETDHTMRPIFYNGSFICGEYLSLSGPSARVHTQLYYRQSGTAVVRSYGESYQLLFYDDGCVVNRPLLPLDDNLQYRLNRFISYFTEQPFGTYNAEDTDNTDVLLRFAYYYLRINEPDALEPVQDGTSRVLLRVEDADRVLYRFFGKTVEHTEDYYYFPMTEGELYPSFSIVGGISENGDGTYRIGFTRWGLYSEERRYDIVPDECYYLSCETQDAYEYRSDLCYACSGTAVIRECTDGENTTYQLISYAMH